MWARMPIVDIFNFTYQSDRWFNKSKKSHSEEFVIGVCMSLLGSPIEVHIPSFKKCLVFLARFTYA